MKNLAGNTECDKFILDELKSAKIPAERIGLGNTEVPYTYIGKIGDWTLTRAWRYWIAKSPEDKGFTLEVAEKLHNKPYPDHMFNDEYDKRGTYGNSVRVAGHCGCPPPKEWLNIQGRMTCYHIDDQEGLNEFARSVNSSSPFRTVQVCDAIKIDITCGYNDPVDVKAGGPATLGYEFYVSPEENEEDVRKFVLKCLHRYKRGYIGVSLGVHKNFLVENLWDRERIEECIRDNEVL